MSVYNYVDVPNSNLICCICRTPFTNPTTTRTCAHTFCKDCILRAIEHSAQCPVDRSPLTASNLAPANPIVRSLVEELVVECVHHDEGCEYTCQRQFLPTHLSESCAYRQVTCPQGICNETMAYKDISLHVHIVDDVEATPDDPQGKTEESTDPETPLHSSPTESAVSTFQGHNDTTPHVALCGQPPDASRVAALTEQNILLRQKVDSLEGMMEVLKREMGAIKGALGPWFRAAEGSGRANGDGRYYSTDIPPRMQPLSASTSTLGATGSAEMGPGPVVVPEYPYSYPPAYSMPGDPLAAYFPSEAEETEGFQGVRRGGATTTAAVNTLGRGHRSSSSLSIGDGHHGFSPPHHLHASTVPAIAPLNLSTTLEGTLHGLRESVVALAGSMDSMGRRHEIGLTNETMRMGEELGGLRAGVHGLRMQVHAIMMDRNAQITGRDGVGEGGGGGGGGPWMPPPPARMYYTQSTKL